MKRGVLLLILSFAVVITAGVPLSGCTEECSRSAGVSGNEGEEEDNDDGNTSVTDYLKPSNYIKDIANHAAFKGFGRLILPWDNSTRYDDIPLSNVGQTMPYHSHVDPATTLAPLNRMIDEINEGKTVFYDIYTDQQKRQNPEKALTGLFFVRGNTDAPFAVVCAGGGFSYVGSLHEGFPYAQQISDRGYNAFVLKYRTGGAQVACEDLAAAISWIFDNAKALGVSTANYSVWGSSAGARMAAYIASHGTASFGGGNSPKPSAIVMAYTGHSEYTSNEPPTYAVIGDSDGIASPAVMRRRIEALRALSVDAEFHLFPNLGHGFGVGYNTSAEGWINKAVDFWEKQINKK